MADSVTVRDVVGRGAAGLAAVLLLAAVLGVAPGAAGEGWKSVDDIPNARIGVITGSVHDGYVARRYPKARILGFSSLPDMVLSCENGNTDAVMIDSISVKPILAGSTTLDTLEKDVYPLPYGFAFSKKNPALRSRFNAFLARSRTDGTYEEMYDRWIRGDPEKAVMPKIAAGAGRVTLVAGVAALAFPFVAQVGPDFVGFDVEMLQRFAKDQGVRLEMQNFDFSALISALASGKVDVIAAGICITEERGLLVDFSDPYYSADSTFLAAKKNLAGRAAAKGGGGPPQASSTFLSRVAESFHANVLRESRYLLIVDGLRTTVVISVLSALFGTLLGALVCFLRMSAWPLAVAFARGYVTILQGTPVLVLLMIIFYVVFASVAISPVIVAAIAFGLNFAAYTSEMFRVGIEGVDRGQAEAGIALGFTRTSTFLHVVLPQALRQILPVYRGEFISLVKMTSIVGYIAVQDLTKASDVIRSRTFDAFFPLFMVAILYFVVSWLLALGLSRLEVRYDPRSRGGKGARR